MTDGPTLEQLANLLVDERSRLIVEDQFGYQYPITSIRAVGTATDDPGIMIRVFR